MAIPVILDANDQSVYLRFLDSTTFLEETGITAATGGLTLSYKKSFTGTSVSVTSPTITTLAAETTAHTDWGIKHCADGTVRVDLPDAAIPTIEGEVTLVSGSATGMIVLQAALVGVQAIGAPAGASVSADIAAIEAQTDDIGAAGAGLTAVGLADGAITAAKIAADAITDAKVAADVTIASVTGAVGSVTGNVGGNVVGSVASVVGAVGSVTGAVGSVTGAVGSVTGNVGGSVASVAAGGITAGSFAAGAIDAAAIATDAIGSAELAASAVTEIQAGLSTLDASGVRTAVGLATANLDTQLDALPTNAELATALGTADDATLAAIAALNNLSSAQAQTAAAAALTAYAPATVGAAMTLTAGERTSIGAAVLAAVVEGAHTVKSALRFGLAFMTGKASGAGTTAVTFRDTGDTKDRIVMVVDSDGDRSAVTLDGSD